MSYLRVASAVIKENDGILLLQRGGTSRHFRGSWQLPEGKIEVYESPNEALQREVYEELGVKVQKAKEVGRTLAHATVDSRNVIVERIVFIVSLDASSLVISDEHDAFKWVTPTELTHLTLYPGTLDAINTANDERNSIFHR
jgi:8-oxo-dGTP diphosphatase